MDWVLLVWTLIILNTIIWGAVGIIVVTHQETVTLTECDIPKNLTEGMWSCPPM